MEGSFYGIQHRSTLSDKELIEDMNITSFDLLLSYVLVNCVIQLVDYPIQLVDLSF